MADQKPITSADLAKAVKLSPELSSLAPNEAPLSDDAAISLIMTRLGDVPGIDHYKAATNQVDIARPQDVATLIAGALPKGMRSATVLTTMDLRPFLDAMNNKPMLDQRWVGQPTKQVVYTAKTTPFVEGETKRLTTANGGQATAYDSSTVTPNPTPSTVPANGGTAASGPLTDPSTGQQIDPISGKPIFTTIDQASGAAQFPVTSMRKMVESDLWTLEQLVNEEGTQSNKLGGGYFPTDIGIPTDVPGTAGPGHVKPGNQMLSAMDAVNYIHTLKPSEVEAMQNKLAAGGYYEQATKDGSFVPGDAFDQNTMMAWKALLVDSIKQNKDAPTVLGTRIKNYRADVRDQRLKGLSTFDPSYSQLLANDYAQSVVGHDLTPEQHAQLNNHLKALISQRADHVAGTGDGASAMPNEQGFTQTDVQESLAPQFGREDRITGTQALDFKLKAAMH